MPWKCVTSLPRTASRIDGWEKTMFPNIFMNAYQQPENKLTYNFLCLLRHYQPPCFLRFLIDDDSVSDNATISTFEPVFGGCKSNPDGMFIIANGDGSPGEIRVFLEVKSYRSDLWTGQLAEHIAVHCEKGRNDRLLVIATREKERDAVNALAEKENVIFKTWREIADYLGKNKPEGHSIVDEFIEYGTLSGEFMDLTMNESDVNVYINYVKSNCRQKFVHLLSESKELIKENSCHLPIEIGELSLPIDHWGRLALEIPFKPNVYGMWSAVGIYHNTSDHGIRFKKDEAPDLAFFLDMNATAANSMNTELKKAFIDIAKENNNFEQNTDGALTKNRWRVMWRRESLMDITEELTPKYVADFYTKCITDLSQNTTLFNYLTTGELESL